MVNKSIRIVNIIFFNICYHHVMYINTLQMGSLTLNFISDDKQKKYYVIIKVRCSNGVAAPSHPTYGYIKNKLPVKIK